MTDKIAIPLNGPIDSQALENFLNNLVDEVGTVSTRNKELEAQIEMLREAHSAEGSGLSRRLSSLSTRTKLLETGTGLRSQIQKLAAHQGVALPDIRVLHSTIAGNDSLVSSPANTVDFRGGYATLRTESKDSLLTVVSDNETVVPDDIGISISQEEGGGTVQQNDLNLALSETEELPYFRTVSLPTDSNLNTVSFEMTVQVPSSISRGRETNLVEVVPYPRGARIVSVKLQSSSLGVHEIDLSTYGEEARRSGLSIPVVPLVCGSIAVKVECDTPKNIAGVKQFNYGISKIGLYNVEYGSTGSFLSAVKNEDGRAISALRSVKHNVSHRDLANMTSGVSPSLVLRVYAIRSSGRSKIFDSTAFPTGNLTDSPVVIDPPATSLEIEGVVRGTAGTSLPPRVYDVAVEIEAEKDFTALSVLSPPLPSAEVQQITGILTRTWYFNLAHYGTDEIDVPGDEIDPRLVGKIGFNPAQYKTVRLVGVSKSFAAQEVGVKTFVLATRSSTSGSYPTNVLQEYELRIDSADDFEAYHEISGIDIDVENGQYLEIWWTDFEDSEPDLRPTLWMDFIVLENATVEEA